MNNYAPRFEIEIKDKKLPSEIAHAIMDVSVTESVDTGAGFSFTVYDEFDMEKQTFKWLDHDTFSVGNAVTIKIGFGSNLNTLVKGIITAMEPSFFSGDTPSISVRGQDLSHAYMKKTSPARTFRNMSYSDIAGAIAREAGLTLDAGNTQKLKVPVHKQASESYFKFLGNLAGKVGFKVWIDLNTMYFKKPPDEKKEILAFQLGKDIISFRPNLNTARLYSGVEVKWPNPQDSSKPIIGKAGTGSERSQESGRSTASQLVNRISQNKPVKVITDVPVESVAQANAVAIAELNKISDNLIEGDGEIVGNPEVRAGVCIKLEKLGERFSGKYFVKKASHTLNSSGYKTRFTVKRNAL